MKKVKGKLRTPNSELRTQVNLNEYRIDLVKYTTNTAETAELV